MDARTRLMDAHTLRMCKCREITDICSHSPRFPTLLAGRDFPIVHDRSPTMAVGNP
jgi:hypothetical protein